MTCTRTLYAALAALLLGACASTINPPESGSSGTYDFRYPNCEVAYVTPGRNQVEVRYTGSGGVQIGWRGQSVLVGPFFSNHNAIRAQFLSAAPNTKRIDAEIARQQLDLTNVQAILVGHSHYDHLGDVPYLIDKYTPGAIVLTNNSGKTVLQDFAHTESFEGSNEPRTIGNFRITAFSAGHAPQFCLFGSHFCYPYARHESKHKWGNLKLRQLGGGLAHAFLIELLDEKRSAKFRIYYTDAASGEKVMALQDDVDLAILCMAGWNYVRNYPQALLDAVKPKHVVVAHYEDFFTRHDSSWRFPLGLTSARAAKFLRIVGENAPTGHQPSNSSRICGPKTAAYTMPVPRAQLLFDP